MPGLLCGLAILLTASGGAAPIAVPADVACAQGSDEQVSLIRRDLKEGEHHLQDGNYQPAIRAFRTGVERLGNEYAPPKSIDDTGQRLVLAGVEERKGHSSVTAHLLHGVLSSRLSLCERKLGSAPLSARRAVH